MSSIKLKANERSWAIQIIQEISEYVKGKPDFLIKRAGGETTINTGNNVMFPDVLLFADNEMSLILQGWELKMPDVPINDEMFIKDSWRKAENLGLTSTVIWNFRYAVFYVKNSETGNFEVAKRWDENADKISENREDVELQKASWMKSLFEVIDEVNRYFNLGRYKPLKAGNVFVNNTFEAFILQNKGIESEYLKEKAKKDPVLSNYVDLWWDSASSEYVNDEKDPYLAFSKVLLLDWINKITFAHIIRVRYPTADRVTEIKPGISPVDALAVFNEITKKCDFFSIFHKLDYQELISDVVWNQLLEINGFLSETKLETIEQQDMQSFLENAVKVSQRVIIGQYTTDYRLADFLVRISVKDATGYCFDPCCGTGTFARALLKLKAEKGIDIDDAYRTVFAEDRQSFPLQIAGLSTVSKESANLPPIVFQKNIFELKVDDEIPIINPKDGQLLRVKVPLFDSIVSNLPFIDFCKHNTRELSDMSAKAAISNEVHKKTGIKLSDRSDYYMYIIFYLWKLLKIGGSICVLTSNSWMGTTAGSIFLQALMNYFKINAVVQSGNGRWFQNAKIVTTAFCLEKKEISSPQENEEICFYLLNSTLKDLKDKSILTKAVGTILQSKEIDSSIMRRESVSLRELSGYTKLNLSFNVPFHGIEWINTCKNKFICVNKLFNVFRGAKTGQDEIFIPASADVVDEDYVYPMLKNSKTCDSLIAEPDNIFVTSDKTYDELQSLGHTKTIQYFKQFEAQLNHSVLQHGTIWYNLKEASKKAFIITGLNPGKRLFYAKFEKPSCINQRLIGFSPKSNDIDINICHALLNSVVGMFYIEATGFGRGAGVLDINKDKFANIFMLNPSLLNNEQKRLILTAFEPLKARKILPVQEELELEDRKNFDCIVLRQFGIEDLYENIKATLLSMMEVRLSVRK